MIDNETLVKRIQQGCDVDNNMTQLYRQNEKLICKMVLKYTNSDHTTDIDDLLQDGYIIFHNAVYGYDEGKGKFSTYLCKCIDWKMNRAMQRKRSVRFPEYLILDMKRYAEFRNGYIESYNREPTDKEYIEHLNITRSRLNGIQQAMKTINIKSLNEPIEETGTMLIDMIESNRNDIRDIESKYDLKLLWREISEILTKKELKTMYLVYIKGITQLECAKILNCSRANVNLLLHKALEKIRKNCKWLADG